MESFRLRQQLQAILAALEEAKDLRECLSKILTLAQGLHDQARAVASGKGNEAAGALRSHVNQLRKQLDPIRPSLVFTSIQRLLAALDDAMRIRGERNEATAIQSLIEKFSGRYEAWIRSYSAPDSVSLILCAEDLAVSFAAFREATELAYHSLEDEARPKVNEAEIVVYLSEPMRLRDFALKVMALDDLYEALALLVEPRGQRTPARIQKIESGSLWAKLVGNSKVIRLMEWAIKGSASFAHRNYTREGKIESVPASLESLDAILQFSTKLKESGVDVDELHEEVRRGAVSVARSLNTLLEGQRTITINNELHSVTQEGQKQLSAPTPMSSLPSGAGAHAGEDPENA